MDLTQIPQAPIQPEGPVPPQGEDLPITEEQKQEMVDLISKIKEQVSHVNAIQFASKGQLDSYKSELLKKVFEELQGAGVDLTDRQSVSDFLTKLKQDSPELADMFEKSMEVLLGGNADVSSIDPNSPAPASLQNNMNIPNDSQNQNQPEQLG